MRKGLCALLIAVAGMAQAQTCCLPDFCGNFEVIGEALLLRPSTCDLNYAIVNVDEFGELPVGKERGSCPNYSWGFRVGVGYVQDCTCNDTRLIWTRHHTCDRSNSSHPATPIVDDFFPGGPVAHLWVTYAAPRFNGNPLATFLFLDNGIEIIVSSAPVVATQRVDFRYDAVDLEFGHREMKCCKWYHRMYAGLQYANIEYCRNAHYEGQFIVTDDPEFPTVVNQITDVQGSSRGWGVGPRFGCDLRWHYCEGVGLSAHGAFGVLAGETRSKMHEHDVLNGLAVDEILDVRNRTRCIVFPEFDASLGIFTSFCFCDCLNLKIEAGYEWRSYVNVLDHTVFNDVAGTNSADCESYNLDGFYLNFTLKV